MHEQQARESFEGALRAAEGRLKLVTAAAAGGCWLAATTLFALLFVVVDHWLWDGVPDRARTTAAWAYWLVSAGWLAAALVWPLTRRINHLYAARMIERSHPDFRNTLVDAVQIGHHAELPGSVRAAVLARAALEVARVNVRASVPTRRLGVVFCGVSAAVAMFLSYAAVSPKSIWPSFLRAFGSSQSAPTRTQIAELSPPDGAAILRGTSVPFAARLSGRRPAEAFVRFSTDGGQTWITGHRLNLEPPTEGPEPGFWQALKPAQDLQQSMAWQVVAGDASSEIRHLEVYPVPEITGIEVRCEYPRYTGLPPATQPGGAIDAPAGTKATIHAAANVPIHQPVLVTGQSPREKRRVLDGPSPRAPTELTATLTVQHDDVYRIEYTDDRGHRNPEPIEHAIRARPDSPPVVKIERPGPQIEMLAEDTLDVAGSLQDDFGLTGAALSYRRAGERTVGQLPLPLRSEPGRRTASLDQRVALSQLSAKPGEMIEWWVSAWDNREGPQGEPARQQADSEVRRILVRPPELIAERPDKAPDEPPETAPSDDKPGDQPGRAAKPGEGQGDGAGTDGAPASAQARADQSRGGQGPSRPQPKNALEQFAQAHASELDTLARHLLQDSPAAQLPTQSQTESQPADQRAGQGQGDGMGQGQGNGQGQGGGEGQPSRSVHAARSSLRAQAEGKGEGQDQAEGQGQGEGEGEAQGQDEGQGEGQAQGEGKGQGQGEGQGQGKGQGQGEGQEQGKGEGQGEGQGKGEGKGQGEGQGQGQGKGEGQGQGEGKGKGQGQGEGKGEGQGQGEGKGQGEGQGAGNGTGEGQGSGGGQGAGQGQSQTTASAEVQSQTDSVAQNQQPQVSQGGGRSQTGGGGTGATGAENSSVPEQPEDANRPPALPSTPRQGGDQLPSVGRVDRLMDALDRALRGDNVPAKLLDELGWDIARAEQFVEQYQRIANGPQPQVERTEVAQEVRITPAGPQANHDVVRAEGPPAAVVGAPDNARPLAPDATHDLVQVGPQRILPRYRPLLEAYYRSVSTRPAH